MQSARMRYRVKGTQLYLNPVARYDAASTGRRASKWGAVNGGPNVAAANLPTLRNRNRDAIRNEALADGAKAVIVSNMIGTGIKPQFATSDAGFNKELSELFLAWTDESDADGALDFYGQQGLAADSMVEAGEVFGRFRLRRREDGLSVPLQIQLLESEYCPTDKTEAYGGNRIVNGIELTPFGQRAAVWMYRNHPYDRTVMVADNAMPVRIPVNQLFHMMAVRRPGQLRGEPWLTRALPTINGIGTYNAAEMARKQTAAMYAGFVRRPAPEGVSVEDLVAAWGANVEMVDGVGMVSMEPGTMQYLEPGEDIEFSQPAEVGGTYEAFLREQRRDAAIAAGILYEQLTGDYRGISDRTYRAALNEMRRRVQMWQHHLVVYQMNRAVHRRWMAVAVLSGAIRPPAGMSERDMMKVKWVPQAWPYLHPVQDVQSAILETRGGFASRAAKVSERGEDVEKIDEEQAADNRRADGAGLSYDSDARRALNDPTKVHPEDESSGEDEDKE